MGTILKDAIVTKLLCRSQLGSRDRNFIRILNFKLEMVKR